MIYIACPYWHKDPAERALRAELASAYAAILLSEGKHFFSPLSHGAAINTHLTAHHPGDWLRLDLKILRSCESVHVITVPGWKESKGVLLEIGAALSKRLPIHTVSPDTFKTGYFAIEDLYE